MLLEVAADVIPTSVVPAVVPVVPVDCTDVVPISCLTFSIQLPEVAADVPVDDVLPTSVVAAVVPISLLLKIL